MVNSHSISPTIGMKAVNSKFRYPGRNLYKEKRGETFLVALQGTVDDRLTSRKGFKLWQVAEQSLECPRAFHCIFHGSYTQPQACSGQILQLLSNATSANKLFYYWTICLSACDWLFCLVTTTYLFLELSVWHFLLAIGRKLQEFCIIHDIKFQ